MRRALLVVLAACGHKATDDCAIVRDDAEHAMEKIAREYPGDPVKAAEVIERCIAPSGEDCERIEKIAKAIPKMIGSAALSGSGYASACRRAPPEVQHCVLPSHILAHADECRAAVNKWLTTPIAITIEPGDPVPAVTHDCGEVAIAIADDGLWLATSLDGKCFAPKTGGQYDWAWLAAELAPVKEIDCRPSVELVAAANVPYQEVVHAMDAAIKAGLMNTVLTTPESMLVQFAGKAPLHCPAPTLIKVPPAQVSAAPPPPSSGTDALAQAPVIAVTKDAITLDGKVVMSIAQATGGSGVMQELAKLLPEKHGASVILQADASTPATVVNRIVTTAKSRGYDNLLFAVKKK